jgi:hypothetical protein
VLRNNKTNVLAGAVYLVRNAPTFNGAQEVSAGSELMLVVTTQMMPTFGVIAGQVIPFTSYISTSGAGEGNAAVDYYRIEGHPLVSDNVRQSIDPSTIRLARNILP